MLRNGRLASTSRFRLAEGIIWDDRADLMRWVDIDAGRVLAGIIANESIEIVEDRHFSPPIAAVALAEDGGLVLAAKRGLLFVSPFGETYPGPSLVPEGELARLNDGSVDPQGRFLVGTLSLDETESRPPGQERLIRVSPDGTVETLRTGVRLSNGLAFAPDGTTVYHVDSFAKTVSRHSYGPGPFDLGEPWEIVIHDFPGLPDGMTTDANGDLWVAVWGGGRVLHFSAEGTLIDEIVLDTPFVTCPGFVGRDLDLLAITTAREKTHDGTTDLMAGAIFVMSAPCPGVPPYRWAGSTTSPPHLASATPAGWD